MAAILGTANIDGRGFFFHQQRTHLRWLSLKTCGTVWHGGFFGLLEEKAVLGGIHF